MKTTWYGGREVCAKCYGLGRVVNRYDRGDGSMDESIDDCPECSIPDSLLCPECREEVAPKDPNVAKYGMCGLCKSALDDEMDDRAKASLEERTER